MNHILFSKLFLKRVQNNETQKSIYVWKTKGKRMIKMGRAQNNELRINDISISRNHAEINISKDEKVHIRDCKSKFGTLVLMKSPESISSSPDSLTTYQIGRSVLVFNNMLIKSSWVNSIWRKFSKSKTKRKELDVSKSKNKYEVSKHSGEANLILEIEIEKLQKNNESEFYLDDEFYDRMADEFIKKKNQPAINHLEIKLNDDEEEPNNTEIDEDEEDDEGNNPLAQTSDGKNNVKSLQQQLARFRYTEPVNNQNNEMQIEVNEEEKKISSISHNNLEIRLDINAPQLKGSLLKEDDIRIKLNFDDNQEDNPRCQSVRASNQREFDAEFNQIHLDSYHSERERVTKALNDDLI